jgi:membrane protease YdiL (CAAX protease family)
LKRKDKDVMNARLTAASLTQRAEFTIVVLAAFGAFITTSAIEVVHVSARISESMLRLMLAYELVVGPALLLVLLRFRGWTAASVGLRPTLRDPIVGLGLAVVTLLSFVVVFPVAAALVPGAQLGPKGGFFSGDLSLQTVIAVSMVNPVFEELFVGAYVITSLTRQGVSTGLAVAVGTGIRILYHLYLGVVVAALGLIPLGLIFGYYFARRRRLWPIVVAHAIIDFLTLGGFVGAAHN